MKNIICLDLSNLTEVQLESICIDLDLDFSALLENKVKFLIDKAYIDLNILKMFAYTLVSDKDVIKYLDIDSVLKSIPVYEKKVAVEVILNADVILDKISKYGVDCLVKEELDFLNTI